MTFTCVTCSLPVETGNYTCFYAESTSRRMHAIALNKARKSQVTSRAWCSLTYLPFAGEFTRGVIADCLQLQVILCGIGGSFSCVCSYFYLRLVGIFTCDSSLFDCELLMFLPAVARKFAWVPHVKLPVKSPWFSGKYTCACRQFAWMVREMLAASTPVNLPVFTAKLHVTQVNCVWGIFKCELQMKLPAFAGIFAHASFTVKPANFFPWGVAK